MRERFPVRVLVTQASLSREATLLGLPFSGTEALNARFDAWLMRETFPEVG